MAPNLRILAACAVCRFDSHLRFPICSDMAQPSLPSPTLAELRDTIARLERPAPRSRKPVLPFGLPEIDQHLPNTGLPLGMLHEIAGTGLETEHATAATLFTAGLAARLKGPVLWIIHQPDLFAPGLAAVGLSPNQVIYAHAPQPSTVLLSMEEGLRAPGLAAVVAELPGKLTLTASRRLQLAAEASGVTAFVLRRSRQHDNPVLAEPIAAVTRWRVSALPAPPPFPDAPDVPGLGPAWWRLDLIRCRGAEPASWVVEACDVKGRLRLAADPKEHQTITRRRAVR
jgi:protein ImuA